MCVCSVYSSFSLSCHLHILSPVLLLPRSLYFSPAVRPVCCKYAAFMLLQRSAWVLGLILGPSAWTLHVLLVFSWVMLCTVLVRWQCALMKPTPPPSLLILAHVCCVFSFLWTMKSSVRTLSSCDDAVSPAAQSKRSFEMFFVKHISE